VTWTIRRLVTAVVTVSLLAGPAPAWADDQPRHASPSGEVAEMLEDLPFDATDVTQTDTSLRSTSTEVTVMAEDDDGSPVVTKLRTDSPAEAEQLAEHLDAQPGVVAAPTRRLRAFGAVNPEPMGPEQWNVAMVGAPDAWGVTRGAGVIVAVIDTGVDATHPDLAGRVLPEIDLLPDVTPDPVDNDHGTRVASLIAASLNSLGMAGVAPEVQILPVAALDPSGVGDSSTVARAIIAAADAGAKVINLSLGGPDPDPVLDEACVYAYTKGAILVAAAGNSYQFGNEVQYPAASPNVIAVAAVDSTGNPAAFSNTGPHIDLAAPGQDVVAAIHGAGYDRQSGTSFAAPHVAGTLAMVAAANPALSAAQIVSVTELTAQDDVSGNGRDEQLGYGVVRSDRAVTTSLSMQSAGLPAGSKVRLRKFNATPEPARRRSVASFTVRVQAKFPDRVWRANPLPVQVRFQFKRSKTKRYRTVAVVASAPDGTASLDRVVTRSGRWRAQVLKPSGRWKSSRSDYLKVRR
jgi:type VII secretion-associated serine protease mycosin